MAGPGSQQPLKNQIIRIARELIESSVKWFINPLSSESDQHHISPFNVNALQNRAGHENYGHDHTR